MNFSIFHYSSFKCHVILQKLFKYADLVLKQHYFFIINVENIRAAYYFCENHNFFSGFFDKQKVQKNSIYLKLILFWNDVRFYYHF